jgi:hypothetical protein
MNEVGYSEQIVRLRLRHYGNQHYRRSLFKQICDVPFRNKPKGGLWTSPVDSEYGWKDWGKDNDYGNLANYFDLNFEGIVFEINSVEDMNNLPWVESDGCYFVSFEQLVLWGYDAIYLTVKGETDTKFTHPKSLYGWDCETVLVMNPDAILVA